jgi:protein O-mannosyl-transferase
MKGEANTLCCPGRGGARLVAAVVVALVIVTAAAYMGVSRNDFVNLDDPKFITSNEHVKAGLSVAGIRWAMAELGTDYWHPLTWISHMLDVSLFGMWAGGHHLVNLAFHIANTLLLFGFLRYATGRLWASALVAALFALHPLHVESVAWASERKDVLSTFFWFATMWMYAYYARRPGWARYVGVVVLFALGLMSKPMLVTVPVILLMLDYWPLERFGLEGWRIRATNGSLRSLVLEKMPLIAMAMAVAAIAILGQRKVSAIAGLEDVSLPLRLTNATVSYWRYIYKMFWPEGLTALYPYPQDPLYLQAAIVIALLLTATAAAFMMTRHRRYILVGWLWYIVTLLPVIGILQVGPQACADRYTYVSLVGPFIIVAWLLDEAAKKRLFPRAPLVICIAAVLVACAIMTWKTVGYWRDNLAFCQRAVSVTSQNYMMLTDLGMTYMSKGRLDDAEEALKQAVRANPTSAKAFCGLAAVFAKKGQLEDAMKCYRQATVVKPDMKEAQANTGAVLLQLGRSDEAIVYLRKALELDPQMALVHAHLGMALYRADHLDEALTELRKAISLDQTLGVAHYNLSVILSRQGDLAGAADELVVAARLTGSAEAWSNLGSCLSQLGRLDEAERAYRDGLKGNPDSAVLRYNLGVLLAKTGRRAEAVSEVRRAAELQPDNQPIGDYLKELQKGQDQVPGGK